MNAPTTPLQQRVRDYLDERRRLGFKLLGQDRTLMNFAHYVDAQDDQGPLSVELMARWARREARPDATPLTWARRIKKLRPVIAINESSDCDRPSERSDVRVWLVQFSFSGC